MSNAHLKRKRTRNEAEKVDVMHLDALKAGDIAVDERVNLTRQLDNVYSCLKRRLRSDNVGQIGFYEFCLDPNDFARSVENIFYVSFLIKETRVKIVFEEDFPQIACISGTERERLLTDNRIRPQTNQGVVSISYQQWKALNEFV
uniref:Non-structural maintenance of chromosomes element 4 n=1 Tax=Syphacia muris TaxID=451379 RepID=A0A0N5AWQ3_9BILA